MLQKKYHLKTFCSLKDNLNVHYKADLFNQRKADKYYDIFEHFLVYDSAEQSKVTVYGKEYYIPRKQTSYGDTGTYYTFAGNTVYSHDWNNKDIVCTVIRNIKHKVETFTGKTFNYVLILIYYLNYYFMQMGHIHYHLLMFQQQYYQYLFVFPNFVYYKY